MLERSVARIVARTTRSRHRQQGSSRVGIGEEPRAGLPGSRASCPRSRTERTRTQERSRHARAGMAKRKRRTATFEWSWHRQQASAIPRRPRGPPQPDVDVRTAGGLARSHRAMASQRVSGNCGLRELRVRAKHCHHHTTPAVLCIVYIRSTRTVLAQGDRAGGARQARSPGRQNRISAPGASYGRARKKPPMPVLHRGFMNNCLAVSYFHMGKPHTIIGAERLHFRVRDGIGWFPLAIATKQNCKSEGRRRYFGYVTPPVTENVWMLYGQASRAISTG